jgi:uncharacterized repeat protein (TIGR01451 family)
MSKFRIIRLCLILLAIAVCFVSAAQAAQHWPSAKCFGYITSGGTADTYLWEAQNLDLVNAGDSDSLVAHKQADPNFPQYAYTVLRYLSPMNIETVNYLYDYALGQGASVEGMFMHYSEDTVLSMANQNAGFCGNRFVRFYQYANSYYASKGDWTISDQAFTFGASLSELIYIGMPDKFTEININLDTMASGTWNAIWEYWNGSAWTALNPTDTTSMLRADGKVSFTPPAAWARTTVNNVKLYWVRLRVTATGTAPKFSASAGVRGANYMPCVDATNGYYQVPGWDEAADVDKDGYLNASEWANHAANKSARFKWWSRVTGREFVDPLSWNFYQGSTLFRNAFVANCTRLVTQSHSGYVYDGIYFDESVGGVSPWLYDWRPTNPISGGSVYEYPKPGKPDCSLANNPYNTDYVTTLAAIRTAMTARGKKTGINLGRSCWISAEQNTDFILRELSYYSHSNYSHIVNSSDNNSLAGVVNRDHVDGVISLVQHQNALITFLGDTTPVWERGKYVGLAIFYLLQNPTLDYYQSWRGDYYTSPQNPKHFANAVKANIGAPTGVIPTGFTQITGPDSKIFIFASGTCPVTGKTYKIIGRDYSLGLVLVKPKPDFAADEANTFGDASVTTHTLPITADNPSGQYYLVNYDGTVSTTPITQITLRNAEGAILVKATNQQPRPNPTITITQNYANLASVKIGSIITYTLTCTNNGSAAASNVVVTDTLPANLQYQANTAKLNGIAISPDPVSGSTVRVTVGSLAVGQTATITLSVKLQ